MDAIARILFPFAIFTVFVWIDNRRPAEAQLRVWHRVVLLGLVFAGLEGLGRRSILLVLLAVLGIVIVFVLSGTKEPD